jgi:hypothetical protein
MNIEPFNMDAKLDVDPIEQETRSTHSRFMVWLPLVGVYAVFMLGNILLPTLFWRMNGVFWLECCAMFSNGVLTSEVALLGAWMALNNDRWTHRLLVCGLLLGSIATCFLIGLQLPEDGLPLEVGYFVYGLSIVGWGVSWFSLALCRRYFGWYIDRSHAPPSKPTKTQVSMFYLLVVITAIACLIAMVKAVMPSTNAGSPGLAEGALLSGIFMLYTLMLFIPSFWLAMRVPTPYWVLLPLMLVLLVVGPITMASLKFKNSGRFDAEEVTHFYMYSLGFIASVSIVFWSLRLFGFELRQKVVQRS